MKKIEITKIIETSPDTVFQSSGNYREFFQITGFTTKQKYTYRSGTGTGATAVTVRYVNCYWSDDAQEVVLRENGNGVLTLTQVGWAYAANTQQFLKMRKANHAAKIDAAKRAMERRDLARATEPALRDALKAAGFGEHYGVVGYCNEDGTTLTLTPQQMVLMVELLNKATAE